jgi:hypothetical protein
LFEAIHRRCQPVRQALRELTAILQPLLRSAKGLVTLYQDVDVRGCVLAPKAFSLHDGLELIADLTDSDVAALGRVVLVDLNCRFLYMVFLIGLI